VRFDVLIGAPSLQDAVPSDLNDRDEGNRDASQK
jgi:hypothetical protein